MAIERKFVAQNLKEFRIKEFISTQLSRVGLSKIKLQRTPLGDKIIIRASRPGLIVGRAGSNIQKLTETLKQEFNLENPQIEIEEVAKIGLDPNIMAEMIVNSLERFGSQRFKGVGHKSLTDIMESGALGVEILISGKIPSQRAKTWRFYQGYLKKCGDVAVSGVDIAYKTAVLKTGAVGVKVSIMPPTTKLPDQILIKEPDAATVEEVVDAKTKEEMAAVVSGLDAESKVGEPKTEPRRKSPKKAEPKTDAQSGARPKRERKPKEETKSMVATPPPPAHEQSPSAPEGENASEPETDKV
jgi:small subunit ribosomal protein S3